MFQTQLMLQVSHLVYVHDGNARLFRKAKSQSMHSGLRRSIDVHSGTAHLAYDRADIDNFCTRSKVGHSSCNQEVRPPHVGIIYLIPVLEGCLGCVGVV